MAASLKDKRQIMKKISIINYQLSIIIAALLMCGTAFAKDLSVAYIDMSYILKNLPQYEQANEQLSMLSKRWQKEIEAAQQEARVMATNYQTEQIFLSEAMRVQREQEIVKKEQEVLDLKRKYFGQDGELYKKREALIKPIQDEIYNAIQDLANEKRIDVALVCNHVYKPEEGVNNYEGRTIFTLQMAYNNARLITRPDSDWLMADMAPSN